MSNELVVREYLGNVIEFKVIDGHVYANANKMAVGFGGSKKLENWKASNKTKEYIDILKASPKFQGTELTIVKQGGIAQEQGTWIHEKLILNFARYLNVEFELWCDEQIETLLREGHVEIKKEYKKIEDSTPLELLERNRKALSGVLKDLNIPKEIIVSTALNETKDMIGYEFNEVKKLLNKQDKEDYLTATAISKKLKIKRNRINETLVLLELEKKGCSSMQPYVLTELGKQYGVERSYTNNKHQGYQILWKEIVFEYIEKHFNEIPIEWIKKD